VLSPGADNFSRYLRAKQGVDDRSLNRWVYTKLTEGLAAGSQGLPLNIVEIGCGIGTMVERLWDWGLVARATYTAIDRDKGLIEEARAGLKEFAGCRHLGFAEQEESIRLTGEGQDWLISLKALDYLAFCQDRAETSGYDLLLAHAFLDLVDLEAGLPRLLALLRPGGWYYFTLIFDGGTIWHPPIDPQFEEEMVQLYHESMDGREGGGGGHSQTGRRVLGTLGRCGGEVLAAGSSDWVVWPTAAGLYPGEEAYFLHYVLETIEGALSAHPELDQERFQAWLSRRRAQIEAGELIFLAHQLDVCGRRLE
jgi:SAM-dependent methyltransferase